ncbi:MAG: hypothetical protein VYE77_11690, partial [Planctomycetota bacterium]|nr:hypothetical protein [Planctomycetota bacterium]
LPHSMINSEDIVIQAQFSIGDLRGIENTSPGAQGHPNIDLPQIATSFGAVGARVPSGSGMAVQLSGAEACGSRLLLVVSPRYPTPRAADTVGTMLVAPVSALTNQSLTSEIRLGTSKPATAETDDEPYEVVNDDDIATIAFSNYGQLEEVLIDALGDSAEISCTIHSGGYLFLSAPAPLREQARSILEALQNRMVRNVGVHCAVIAHEVTSASTLASEAPDGEVLALHEVALPCLAGRTSVLFRGIEQNAVEMLQCEIAQGSSILGPIVNRQSSGLWAIACPSSDKNGIDCDMTLQFVYQGPPERRAITPSGMLMLNQSSAVRAQPRQRFSEQPLEVAAGTSLMLDGRFYKPRLTVACK